MRRSILPLFAALALVPSTAGCVAAAVGVGAGYLISREVLPNDLHTAQVQADVDHTWQVAQETMEMLSMEPVEVQDFPRRLTGEVDGADVVVEVLAYDLDRTVIRVSAEKYTVSKSETANRVLTKIIDRL